MFIDQIKVYAIKRNRNGLEKVWIFPFNEERSRSRDEDSDMDHMTICLFSLQLQATDQTRAHVESD